MTYLEGVYWDLDGTIANTELEAHLPAFNNAFKEFGLNWYWNEHLYLDLLKINGGKNRIAHYSKITKNSLSDDLIIKIHQKKQYYYLNFIKNDFVKLKTGVLRLITELYEKEVRQFIVTSSSKCQVNSLLLNLFGKFKPFEFIISSDDVTFHKPNPLPYMKATQLSGIKNKNAVVIEDSNAGIRSALGAGLPTIFVHSNLPTVIDDDLKLKCIIDGLGDNIIMSNVIKGPKITKNYIDYDFLNNYLSSISHAKY